MRILPAVVALTSLLLSACQAAPALRPAASLNAQSQLRVEALPEQWIVRLVPGVNPQDYARSHGLELRYAMGLDMYAFRGSSRALQSLGQDRRTRWSEPNQRLSLPTLASQPAPAALPPLGRTDLPNDPLLPAQYGYRLIGTERIWRTQPGSPEVVVAVVDSGIDGSHPEFQGQLVPGWDFTLKQPGPGGNLDKYGHGTHVAGVIGALSNNGQGVAGVAPGCRLMPVRIFNDFGHSESGYSTAAIIWAVDHGAKVINASWGSPMEGEAAKAAYQYALQKDVVFVAAVGNSGKEDTQYYPGASEEAIGVAATTDIDGWGSFSTFGEWVDLAAPGKGILSTYPLSLGNGYRIMDGTSMAAPFVSAAAALVRSQYPTWSAAQVRAQLERTAKDVIMSGKDKYAGHGRIDVLRALQEVPSR
ncbi:MAG: S8 family serine peptidase [Candidatus Sericytochromatia bacterium]